MCLCYMPLHGKVLQGSCKNFLSSENCLTKSLYNLVEIQGILHLSHELYLPKILNTQGTKIFQYCTRPAGRVTYNFHSSCKHMYSPLKIVCSNKENGGGGGMMFLKFLIPQLK